MESQDKETQEKIVELEIKLVEAGLYLGNWDYMLPSAIVKYKVEFDENGSIIGVYKEFCRNKTCEDCKIEKQCERVVRLLLEEEKNE